jgi:pimeloyl-ACP methyl ester carboxylesterase
MTSAGGGAAKSVVVDGRLVNYVDEGKGKVVLILHGWGSSGRVFSEMIKDLAKGYRVVAPDFAGFGGSAEPAAAWDVAGYVRWTKDFLEKLGVKEVFAILGHSFGGRVVLKGVGEGVLSAEKLILVDSAGLKPRVSARRKVVASMSKVGKVLFRGKVGERIKKSVYDRIGARDYVEASPLMKEVFKKTVSEDLRKYISGIKTKSLVIWGEDDLDTPVADAYELAEIKGARLVILPEAGHYVFFDKPAEVLREIREFLK